jgi:hypothetical protein
MSGAQPAAGAEPPPVWVWYRSSEGCPDGASFVSRLSELGNAARLASVGDRVDFVVTLGSGPTESSGRLERQTRGGTVAIREYRDARCEQVAEALALTLDLALEPEAPAGELTDPSSSSVAAASRSHAHLPPPLPASSAPMSARSATPASAVDTASSAPTATSAAHPPSAIALGAQATLNTGIAPGALPGGALFVAGQTGRAWLSAWRATLFGGYRTSRAEQREIEVLLAGGRIEGCPIEIGVETFAFSPCLGLDVGLLRATGPNAVGATDTGPWSAVVAHGRVAAALSEELSLELQAGAQVPLVRYEMGTRDGTNWFRSGPLGVAASVGAAWRIP